MIVATADQVANALASHDGAGFLGSQGHALSYDQNGNRTSDTSQGKQVYQVGQQVCVPFDCYEDVLVMQETSREEQGAYQLKYYARGVGNVLVGWRGADASQEELELIDVVHLDADALAEVRAEALNLEARAYEISTEVYAHTSPAEFTPDGEGQ